METIRTLAQALKDYAFDAAPGGLLNPEWTPDRVRTLAEVASMTPTPVGDAASVWLTLADLIKRDYGSAAGNAIGFLPFVPAMGGMLKTPVGRIPETGAETRNLAEMLKRAGEKAGYSVSHEGSAISPSQYVTFRNAVDQTGNSTRQVRISNHADKYPELANGVRTSVDPATEVSFEQAVNWLGREGFPTSLSSKYKNVPTWDQYYAAKRVTDSAPEARLQKMIDAWRNQPKATRGPMPTLADVK